MKSVLEVLRDSSSAKLCIAIEQQPEPLEQRVAIEGDVAGFRMLADVLCAMADFVEAKGDEQPYQLVLDSQTVPQLTMPEKFRLRLECNPQ